MEGKLADRIGDVTVLELSGWLVAGKGAADFQQIIHEYISQGVQRFALGFSGVGHMDESGFAALLKAWNDVGGELVVFGAKELIKWKLEMAAQVAPASIGVFDSRDEAVNSFFPKRKGQLICMPSR